MRVYIKTPICLLVSCVYFKQDIKAQPSLPRIDWVISQHIKPNETGGVLLLAKGR